MGRASGCVGLALVACGSSRGPAPYDEAAFCNAVGAALCACCDDCDEGAQARCRDGWFGPVHEGLAEVEPGHADECRSGFERAQDGCTGLTPIEAAACEDMLEGRLEIGAACSDPRVCEGGVCLGGACADLGQDREPCVAYACDRGLYCNLLVGECRELRGFGDACETGGEPQCAPEYRCVDNRCFEGLPDSAPCTDPAQCESLACEEDRCAPAGPGTLCG